MEVGEKIQKPCDGSGFRLSRKDLGTKRLTKSTLNIWIKQSLDIIVNLL